jgi:hypothetical protein
MHNPPPPWSREEEEPFLQWNGLPENHRNDLFLDSELPEAYTKESRTIWTPFCPCGQYGMWMGI